MEQVAGDVCGVVALALQGAAVEAAAGHFHLGDGAVGQDLHLLRHALAAEHGAVGVAVVEDVVIIADLFQAAVVVGAVVHGLVGRLVGIDMHVRIADDDAAEDEILARVLAGGVAQLMHHDGGIHKVVGIAKLADGGSLEELMALKAAALGVGTAGHHVHRLFQDGEHVLVQHRHHGAVAALVVKAGKTGVHVGHVALGENAGVELRLVALTVAQLAALAVMHIAVELVAAGGFVAHGNGHAAELVQHVVQVVAAVGALGHVRGVEAGKAAGIERIVGAAVDDAFITPVRQIVHRGRVAHIVAHAEHIAVETVMGAIDVHAVTEYMRFTVRDIFPAGHIGIECLHKSYRLLWNFMGTRLLNNLIILHCKTENKACFGFFSYLAAAGVAFLPNWIYNHNAA